MISLAASLALSQRPFFVWAPLDQQKWSTLGERRGHTDTFAPMSGPETGYYEPQPKACPLSVLRQSRPPRQIAQPEDSAHAYPLNCSTLR